MDNTLEPKIYRYLKPALIAVGYAEDAIIFGYENGAQPVGNAVILAIQDVTEDTYPERRYEYIDTNNPDKTIQEYIRYRSMVTVSLDFWGDNVFSRARAVKARMHSTELIEAAQVLSLGFRNYSNTRNLAGIHEQGYKARAVFDLFLHHAEDEVVTIETIGQVRVHGDTDDNVQVMDDIIQEPNYTP